MHGWRWCKFHSWFDVHKHSIYFQHVEIAQGAFSYRWWWFAKPNCVFVPFLLVLCMHVCQPIAIWMMPMFVSSRLWKKKKEKGNVELNTKLQQHQLCGQFEIFNSTRTDIYISRNFIICPLFGIAIRFRFCIWKIATEPTKKKREQMFKCANICLVDLQYCVSVCVCLRCYFNE